MRYMIIVRLVLSYVLVAYSCADCARGVLYMRCVYFIYTFPEPVTWSL